MQTMFATFSGFVQIRVLNLCKPLIFTGSIHVRRNVCSFFLFCFQLIKLRKTWQLAHAAVLRIFQKLKKLSFCIFIQTLYQGFDRKLCDVGEILRANISKINRILNVKPKTLLAISTNLKCTKNMTAEDFCFSYRIC